MESMAGLALLALGLVPLTRVSAQRQNPAAFPVFAGSETERYLRALQLVGKAEPTQWTVRPFGPRELSGKARQDSTAHSQVRRRRLGPVATLTENSGVPYGFNDGPVWAGKGLTAAVIGGVSGSWRGLSAVLSPVAFLSENRSFPLAPTTANSKYADWYLPGTIDKPQRFGPRSYGRLDFGETQLRVDTHGLTAGVSASAEVWGPASEHPIVLGNNAGGIPRVFAGTARPVHIGFLAFHGRVIWGRLDESAFGPDTGVSRKHFVTGGVGTAAVDGVPGLEIGAARFFHVDWPQQGLRHAPWGRVFQAFLRGPLRPDEDPVAFAQNPDNQVASVFLRWAPPAAGFEAYFEFGREDRNSEREDLIQEPDHDSAYLLGFQRAWSPAPDRVTVIRAEVLNSRVTFLQQSRVQTPWYVHGGNTAHGHTQRGQVLGSVGAHGGGAVAIALDRYSSAGRTTYRLDRLVQAIPLSRDGFPDSRSADVMLALGVERSRFTSRGEVIMGAALVKEYQRYFGNDAFNLNLSMGYGFR